MNVLYVNAFESERIYRPRMRAFTHGHFRSRDKDGGCTIRSAVLENLMLHANVTALCLMLPVEVLHCRNRNFRPFYHLWRWPWPNDLYIRIRPVVRWYTSHVQIWTSYVKAFESYRLTDRPRQTDTTKIIYHAASWVVTVCLMSTNFCSQTHTRLVSSLYQAVSSWQYKNQQKKGENSSPTGAWI